MASSRAAPKDPGAPTWIVTFADLMSLLVCFFVLIISFSIQDQEKLQVVAGSIREAFGVKDKTKKRGVIEFEELPVKKYQRRSGLVFSELDTDFANFRHDQNRRQGPEADTYEHKQTKISKPRSFALASESLRQALQDLPEITEVSKNIILETTEEGLHIQLIDQDGRAMFDLGSTEPNERATQILRAMTPTLRAMPNRVRITGHTDRSGFRNTSSNFSWSLSVMRANAIRTLLSNGGLSSDRFFSIAGKADTDPLIPEAPELSVNRRISILLMSEEPPLPKKRLF